MRRADFRRAEESALNRAAQSPKVSENALGAARCEHAADVLEEECPGAGLDEDPPRVRPEVALVVFAEPLAGEAVRLARDAANDEIHDAAPSSAVEGSGIAPDRARSQETLLHRRNQMGDGEGFPLHHADCASSWNCQLDAEVEPAASGAEGEDVDGIGRQEGGR
jgi:hypothetical protein